MAERLMIITGPKKETVPNNSNKTEEVVFNNVDYERIPSIEELKAEREQLRELTQRDIIEVVRKRNSEGLSEVIFEGRTISPNLRMKFEKKGYTVVSTSGGVHMGWKNREGK